MPHACLPQVALSLGCLCGKCPDAARLHHQRAKKTRQQSLNGLWPVPCGSFLDAVLGDLFTTDAVPGRSAALDVCVVSSSAAAARGDAAQAALVVKSSMVNNLVMMDTKTSEFKLLAHFKMQVHVRRSILCIFGSQTFMPIPWSCKKQTAVSRNNTEAEIISLDAGVRTDGIPALSLWDTVIAVLEPIAWRNPQQSPTQETSWTQQFTSRFRLCDTERILFQHESISSCFRGQRSCDQNDFVALLNPNVRHVVDLDWLVV